ncbi:hypothetical protein FHW89_001288 [Mucilaginibacter sp. SG564]|nr:hypothetical protein [Mucilaginibacter sp. SG564]
MEYRLEFCKTAIAWAGNGCQNYIDAVTEPADL